MYIPWYLSSSLYSGHNTEREYLLGVHTTYTNVTHEVLAGAGSESNQSLKNKERMFLEPNETNLDCGRALAFRLPSTIKYAHVWHHCHMCIV